MSAVRARKIGVQSQPPLQASLDRLIVAGELNKDESQSYRSMGHIASGRAG